MSDLGPQKQPASVNQIEAQVKQAKRELQGAVKINPGHYVEALDRIHMLQCHLETAFEHPVLEKWERLQESIRRTLDGIYQAVADEADKHD